MKRDVSKKWATSTYVIKQFKLWLVITLADSDESLSVYLHLNQGTKHLSEPQVY